MIPFQNMPGIPPLFLAFARGEARAFFPDEPSAAAAAERGARISASSGGPVYVAAGQQAGLFTGPLLASTKAAAALRMAASLSKAGVAARALFWVATEDHDLAEIARATILLPSGPRTFRLDEAGEKGFRPAGLAAIPEKISEIFDSLAADGTPSESEHRFRKIWSPGRNYAEAFRDTFEWMFDGHDIRLVDPLDSRWKEAKFRFFEFAVSRARELTAALDAADERLRGSGFEPQVSRTAGDFPCYLILDGVRRKISWSGRDFSVHGEPGTFSARDLLEFAAERHAEPSTAALLRPVLQAHLFPIAAQILGPSELAYHAQTISLFPVFELDRPVFLPRPHLIPRGARERRALTALGVDDENLFHLRESVRGELPAAASKLQAIEAQIHDRVAELAPEIAAIDATLQSLVLQTAQKAAAPLSRLREKVALAAERRDSEKWRRVESIENALTPDGLPADRVYSPLTYLSRFGTGFLAQLLDAAECSTEGARFLECE